MQQGVPPPPSLFCISYFVNFGVVVSRGKCHVLYCVVFALFCSPKESYQLCVVSMASGGTVYGAGKMPTCMDRTNVAQTPNISPINRKQRQHTQKHIQQSSTTHSKKKERKKILLCQRVLSHQRVFKKAELSASESSTHECRRAVEPYSYLWKHLLPSVANLKPQARLAREVKKGCVLACPRGIQHGSSQYTTCA